MADATTKRKIYKQENGKIITALDMQAHTGIALDLDSEDNFGIVSAEDGVIGGYEITFDSGNDFQVGTGTALFAGELLKDTTVTPITLDDNVDPGNTREDVISISGPASATSDNSTEKLVASITVTPLTGVALGTGDDVTTVFDLGQYNVVFESLIVKLDGAVVAAWQFYPQGGAANGGGLPNNDAIKFEAAPAAAEVVTADFTHIIGGDEYTPGVGYPTRWEKYADVVVTKGTPGLVTLVPSGHIYLGTITVPPSWAGGSSHAGVDVVINNGKTFLTAKDSANDRNTLAGPNATKFEVLNRSPFTRPARVTDLVRNIRQIREGCRLRYDSSTTVKVGPGFLSLEGLSQVLLTDQTLTLQNSASGDPGYVNATGWWAIYARPASVLDPGGRFILDCSQSGPTGQRNISIGLASGYYTPAEWPSFFLGWVYLTAYTPSVVIRPFYSYGSNNSWVYWENPGSIDITPGGGSPAAADHDISAWCPSTGRLVEMGMNISWQASTGGDTCQLLLASHKGTPSAPLSQNKPDFQIYLTGDALRTYFDSRRGIVRAEDGAARNVNSTISWSGGSVVSAYIWVVGYLDDYTTLSETAGGILAF